MAHRLLDRGEARPRIRAAVEDRLVEVVGVFARSRRRERVGDDPDALHVGRFEGTGIGAVESDHLLGVLARIILARAVLLGGGLDAAAELRPAQLARQLLRGLPVRFEGAARGDGRAQVGEAPGGEEIPQRRLFGRARLQGVEVGRLGPAGIEPLQPGDLGLHPRGLLLRGVVAQRALVDHAGRDARLGIDHDRGCAGAVAVDEARSRLSAALGGGGTRAGQQQRGEGDQDFTHDGYRIRAATSTRRWRVVG